MAKMTNGDSSDKDRKSKHNQQKWLKTTLMIAIFGGAMIWIGLTVYSREKVNDEVEESRIIEHSLVCMVNNKYMGEQQIAVPINEKIYYGCCQKCVADLTTDESTRFALDPISKKTVDKAMAFIILDPNKTGTVLYFESEENISEYLKHIVVK